MQYMFWAEYALFTVGILLILYALFCYMRRTGDYQGFWRVFVNRLKDGFIIAEFKFYRAGVLLLIFGILMRFINLVLFPY